jgi:carbamoyltransferase
VDRYFVTTAAQKDFPYMSVVLDVRPEWRDGLAAITHIDGTARIQTVARDTNPRYWELLRSFGDRAGVSVLLNTSFNNPAEPIVDSARRGDVLSHNRFGRLGDRRLAHSKAGCRP